MSSRQLLEMKHFSFLDIFARFCIFVECVSEGGDAGVRRREKWDRREEKKCVGQRKRSDRSDTLVSTQAGPDRQALRAKGLKHVLPALHSRHASRPRGQ